MKNGLGRGAAGVAALYHLASDKLRGRLGSQEVFERAFGNTLYAPLLEHDELRAGAPVVIDGSARAELAVTVGGETAVYQVGMVLAKHGDRAGQWCLSGVFREGVDL